MCMIHLDVHFFCDYMNSGNQLYCSMIEAKGVENKYKSIHQTIKSDHTQFT